MSVNRDDILEPGRVLRECIDGIYYVELGSLVMTLEYLASVNASPERLRRIAELLVEGTV